MQLSKKLSKNVVRIVRRNNRGMNVCVLSCNDNLVMIIRYISIFTARHRAGEMFYNYIYDI